MIRAASQPPPESSEVSYYLLRVYKESVQRLPCELNSLSSYAAFVIICVGGAVTQRRCILWIGASCAPADRTIAEKLSLDVAVEDLGSATPDCMTEDRENLSILDAVLDTMWVQLDDYRRSARARATTAICNRPSFLYSFVKDPVKVPAVFNIISIRNETPEPSTGKIAKFVFPTGADKNSILAVNVGDQYDLWFGENVNGVDQALVKSTLRNFAVEKAPENRRGIESVMFSRNLRVVSILDRTVFRYHFTTESAKRIVFGPSVSSNISSRHSRGPDRLRSGLDRGDISSTSSNGEGCSDCVGVTILRFLGMAGDSAATRLFWGSNSSDLGRGGSRPIESLSPEAEEAAIHNKIKRLTQKIDIKFLNPPRWGSKLLVLDLDHTLIDFSCRFDYMFEQLKRPYLDRFLASCYRQQYDIAIWSQTNWKWLELKLTELGMLNRKDYKICFALDKSSMFTVRQNYIKPLQLIWNKFGDRWSHKNTIHVDDLSRNFELNKKNGLVVSPFYLNPADAAAAAAAAGAASNGYGDGSSTMGLPPPPGASTNPADDEELDRLMDYLTDVAKLDDFCALDHGKWRVRAGRVGGGVRR